MPNICMFKTNKSLFSSVWYAGKTASRLFLYDEKSAFFDSKKGLRLGCISWSHVLYHAARSCILWV